MKRLFLGLCMLMSMAFCYAGARYNAVTKTLTVYGETNAGQISYYDDATTLIVQDTQALNNMANQYGQLLTKLENLVLPSDITTIPNQVFKNCKKLVNVNWEDLTNLKVIGEEAFKIYSKSVLKKTVEIETNVDELADSIETDIKEIVEENNEKKDEENKDYKIRFKTKAYNLYKRELSYSSCYDLNYGFLSRIKVEENNEKEEEQ